MLENKKHKNDGKEYLFYFWELYFKKWYLEIWDKIFKSKKIIDKRLYISYKNRFIAEKNFNLPSYKIVYESLKKYEKNE